MLVDVKILWRYGLLDEGSDHDETYTNTQQITVKFD
jgi:hypothetical protein